MSKIEWVVCGERDLQQSVEFDYAEKELRRQIPLDACWIGFTDVAFLTERSEGSAQSLVLLLEHPLVTLDRRCLERLSLGLTQGFEVVEACDSRCMNPMSGGYATLRGMERFVDEHSFQLIESDQPFDTHRALVRLTTVAALQRMFEGRARVGRAVGAFAHDVSDYFASNRSEVLALVPASINRCLDVGGGQGNFLKMVKAARGCETHLVEIDPEVARLAEKDGQLNSVWVGDFLSYRSQFTFDCISFLDMLEHIVDPQRYLMHARQLLDPGGVVVASIPNVGHWSVIADLIEARWDYVPVGIHCITHLRFFTLKTIQDLFDRAGFQIVRSEPVYVACPPALAEHWQRSPGLTADTGSINVYAYLVVARPRNTS